MEITNDELRVSIAEEWEYLPYPDDCYKEKRHWWRSPPGGMENQFGERWFLHLPLDWPTDTAVAINDLIDNGNTDGATLGFLAGSWRVSLSIGNKVCGRHFINDSLARAISEAWLTTRRSGG